MHAIHIYIGTYPIEPSRYQYSQGDKQEQK